MSVLASRLLVQPPADMHPKRQQMMVQIPGSLTTRMESQTESWFLAPGCSLPQCWQWQVFKEGTSGWMDRWMDACVCVSPHFKQIENKQIIFQESLALTPTAIKSKGSQMTHYFPQRNCRYLLSSYFE